MPDAKVDAVPDPTDDAQSEVTVDFDHHAPGYAVNPYPQLADLRARCPVAWTEAHEGFWVLTDYASVYEATRDHETFRSNPAVTIPSFPKPRPLVPQETDSPEAQKWRRILYQDFSPEAAARMEPQIYDVAHEMIDGFIESGTCDLIADLAIPVPARVMLRILGFDETRWTDFAGWVHTIAHGAAGGEFSESALEGAVAFYGEIWGLIEDRRSNGMRDDVVSKLLQSEFDGQPLTDEDVIDYTMLLLFGGLDTTTGVMGNALVRMDQERDVRGQLLEQPDLIPTAVEEFIRLYCPAQAQSRTLAADVEMHGHTMRTGERVLMLWAAANRDPAVFPDPDAVRFDREEVRHLGFGVGLHRCLGSSHGRAMFRIMLELVLTRLPDFELTDDPDKHRYEDAGTVYGLHSLPARFTPGPRRDSSVVGASA